ncbi:glycosyltransferase [Aestuariibacter sp. GS-14]|uniref:glycosyltransferase n=1 Tax=Aestuariibacter sp. GS-14 TaxID=2590670 RepID=UPI00112E4EAA|nr:glycosyltransferase [Aestuariibacter sp. GS-14]TPV56078.1 glycosyltransferase [Aestuariibacter sp. GS-14]
MTPNFSIKHRRYQVHRVESIVAMGVYCKDNPQWLDCSIQSIRQQSYADFLYVIVVDGAIPDTLMSVISAHAQEDDRIVIVEGKQNCGLATCMNFAIDWSLSLQPAYFFRMDADDISEPDRFIKQIDYLEKHAHISILGTGLTEINEKDKKVGSRVMPLTNRQITRLLPRRCAVNHPTVCIRYRVFNDGHRYDDSLRFVEDYLLWIELASHGYIFCNLKDKLLKFRRVGDFYKRRGFVKSFNEFRARFRALRKLKRMSLYNLFYAVSVLILRLMPASVVKLAYKLDRHYLERFIKH